MTMKRRIRYGLLVLAAAAGCMGCAEEGKAAFRRACELQPSLEYRGNLDPEIRELITTR